MFKINAFSHVSSIWIGYGDEAGKAPSFDEINCPC
jgi:hypothetical protein